MAIDRVRTLVLDLVAKNGTDLKTVSLAMPRNHAYLHQFITKNKPHNLPEAAREALGRIFGVDPDQFRSDAQAQPASENALIRKIRGLSKADKEVIERVLDGLAGSHEPPSAPAPTAPVETPKKGRR